MCVLLIVLLSVLLIALIPVRLVVKYDGDGLHGYVGVLLIKKKFPKREKQSKKETVYKSDTESVSDKKEKSFGKLKELTWMLKPILKTLGKLVRMIVIKRIEADIRISGEDSARTALLYGEASAGIGAIIPVLDRNIKIKKKSIYIAPDFQASESVISLYANMYLRVWKLIVIVLFLLYQLINKKRNMDKQKGIEQNG